MNEDSKDNSVMKDALTIAGTGLAIAGGVYAVKNRKRIFNKDNLEFISNNKTEEIFNNVKEKATVINPDLNKVTMKKQKLFNMHYSASDDNSINVLGATKGTLGLNYLRVSNDPIYQNTSKIYGRDATNEDMLNYIIGHEFGHQDHFSKNIIFEDTNTSSNRNRKAYKQSPKEVYADTFSESLLKTTKL